MKKKKESSHTIKNVFFSVKTAFLCDKKNTILFFLKDIISGLYAGFFNSFFIQLFYTMLEKESSPTFLYLFLVGMFVAMLLENIISLYGSNQCSFILLGKITQKINQTIYQKSKTMDYKEFDNPDYYNDFMWASKEGSQRIFNNLTTFSRIFYNLIPVLIIGTLLFTIEWFIAILVIVVTLLTVFLSWQHTKSYYKRNEKIYPIQRKNYYIERVFYLKEYSNDIRINPIDQLLIEKRKENTKELNQIYKKSGWKIFLYSILQTNASTIFIQLAVPIWLGYRLIVQKNITTGEFSASIVSIFNLYWNLRNLIGLSKNFKENSLYLNKYHHFIAYKSTINVNDNQLNCDEPFQLLEVKNVSFWYQDENIKALNDVSFSIKRNEKVAFVGINGAGKTTMIKLLLRLYDPLQGEICFNQKNIKAFNVKSYQNHFGTIMQDFQIYAMSIAKNITMDDLEEDENRIYEVLKQVGLDKKIEQLPLKIKSNLTKEFDKDGVDFSGGERQRLAIARCLYHDNEILILDEPSSALDPLVENEINEKLFSIAKNKTVILITHRLSSIKNVDKIFVFKDGKIIEQGNHQQLMELNKEYAAMFKIQSKKYQSI